MKSSMQSALLAFMFLTVMLSGCGSPAAIRTTATALPTETMNLQPTTQPDRRGTGDIPTALSKNQPAGSENNEQYLPVRPVEAGSGCILHAKNQNPDLDGVVILAEIDTHAVVAAVYVRSNDSVSQVRIPAGTYQLFAGMGQDWDGWTGRFLTRANYFRFVDPVTLDSCSFSGSNLWGSQRIDVTLNTADGTTSDTVPIAPDAMPGFTLN